MATVTRENIGTLHDKITVKLTKEDYMPSFEKSLKQYAKQANVPGFRKGMVPSGMVRKMYGQSIFGEEIFRSASKQLEEYLINEKLNIFAQPLALPLNESFKLDMNNPADANFDFEIGLKPDFEITPLANNAKLTAYKIEVSDKMLSDETDRIRRRYGKVEDKEAIDSKEDILYATYEACDEAGNIFADSTKVEDTVLMERLPEALVEKLMGKKAEDSIVFKPSEIATGEALSTFIKEALKQEVTAADNYFKLTITKVGLLQVRDLDAELYAQVFPNDDIKDEATFTEKLKGELSKEYDRIGKERLQNEMYELLVHGTQIELPVTFLKRWMKEGQEKPRSEAEVEKEFPSFDHQLRWTLISDKLILDNGIQVTKENVLDELKGRVLSYFGMKAGEEAEETAPWLDSYMQKVMKDEKTMEETYRRMMFDKLFQWLETKFDVKEQSINEEEFFKLANAHDMHHHH
ncbi:MAG TPA: trigger factor [Flavipsychrobacter sp.]|jgi:trigger factor|nr:trigger factor [Flavipsychrobacter sp.]